MSRLQVIFFDAAGTLFRVRGSVAEVYVAHAEKYGVARSAAVLAAVDAAFRRAFREAPAPVFAASDPAQLKQCERLWWFDLVHHVWYRVGMFEGFDDYFDEVFQAFDGPGLWELYPETLAVLKSLKERGYELGIISNFDSRVFNVLRGLGVLDQFDSVTISSLSHAAKPAPKIFTLALEKHACDPGEAAHVGDSLRDDVEGARAVGLHGILLDRTRSCATASAPMLGSLDELPGALERL